MSVFVACRAIDLLYLVVIMGVSVPEDVLFEWCTLCNHAILICPREDCDWCSCNGADTCELCAPLDEADRAMIQAGIYLTREEVEAQPGYILPEDRPLGERELRWLENFGRLGMGGVMNHDFYQWGEKIYRLRKCRNRFNAEVYRGGLTWRKIGYALSSRIMGLGTKMTDQQELESALEKYDLERPKTVAS